MKCIEGALLFRQSGRNLRFRDSALTYLRNLAPDYGLPRVSPHTGREIELGPVFARVSKAPKTRRSTVEWAMIQRLDHGPSVSP